MIQIVHELGACYLMNCFRSKPHGVMKAAIAIQLWIRNENW